MLPFWTIFSRSCLDWTYDHLGTCYRKRQHQIWRYHHHGHVGYEQRHDRYPMIRLRFVHRHYQQQHMADGCSCSNQCGLGWQHLVWLGPSYDFKIVNSRVHRNGGFFEWMDDKNWNHFLENGWHVDGFTSGSTIGAINGYNWTSSHNYSGPIQVWKYIWISFMCNIAICCCCYTELLK